MWLVEYLWDMHRVVEDAGIILLILSAIVGYWLFLALFYLKFV